MHKAKLTSKGQITIPGAVREKLGVKPGDKILFLATDKGEFRMRRMGSIMDLYGCLAGAVDAPKTNAELDELLSAYALESDKATMSDKRTKSDSEAA